MSPDRISQRFAHESSKAVYADMDAFLADVVAIEREMIAQLARLGHGLTAALQSYFWAGGNHIRSAAGNE